MPSPTGYSAASNSTLSGNNQIDSLLFGTHWGTTRGVSLTYSFAAPGTSYFATDYSDSNEYLAMYALSAGQRAAATSALAAWSQVANIRFTLTADNATSVGDLRFAGYGEMDDAAAWAYLPGGYAAAGDVWVGPATNEASPTKGSYDYLTFIHEIGHAIGLKHPFDYGEGNYNLLPARFDDVRYTVMSYNDGYSFAPTGPMLLDIAAIQYLYGANTTWKTGNDTYRWAPNQSIFETLWDAGGIDTLDASNQGSAVVLRLKSGEFSKIGQAFFNYSTNSAFNEGLAIAYGATIENAIGSAYNDTLYGNATNNLLNGGAGIDSLIGGLGNDIYVVDNAADRITELASQGTDLAQSLVSHTLAANVENLTLLGSAAINGTGNALANRLTGNAANNTLNGGAGADSMSGGLGNDTYVVDNAADQAIETSTLATELDSVLSYVSWSLGANLENLTLAGSAAINGTGNGLANRLTGNAANNTLNGGGGNDSLFGGLGNDTLIGGLGKDSLKGDAGADIFSFRAQSEMGKGALRDVVLDFNASQGDRIDLATLDANSLTTANDAFRFIGSAAFSGAGQLRFADQVLYGNLNGDLIAEFEIQLVGVSSLGAGNLIA
ncbi:Serralysin A precursor [compost metagenome]